MLQPPCFRYCAIEKNIEFSNELSCVLPVQGAAKLPDVEVWGPKEWWHPVLIESDLLNKISLEPKMSDFFSDLQP